MSITSCYGFGVITISGGITLLTNPNPVNTNDYTHVYPYYWYYMIINYDTQYFQILLHSAIEISYDGCCCFACFDQILFITKQICALHAIVSHKLVTLVDLKTSSLIPPECEENFYVHNLIIIVQKHNSAINKINKTDQIYNQLFFIYILIMLVSITFFIFDMIMVYSNRNFGSIIRIGSMTIMVITFIFNVHLAGEQVIQVTSEVRTSACAVSWYLLPLKAQKMLQMIICRSIKPGRITCGSVAVISLESFGSILKTAWSASAVLLKRQDK